jgi:hypothetical protein
VKTAVIKMSSDKRNESLVPVKHNTAGEKNFTTAIQKRLIPESTETIKVTLKTDVA